MNSNELKNWIIAPTLKNIGLYDGKNKESTIRLLLGTANEKNRKSNNRRI